MHIKQKKFIFICIYMYVWIKTRARLPKSSQRSQETGFFVDNLQLHYRNDLADRPRAMEFESFSR